MRRFKFTTQLALLFLFLILLSSCMFSIIVISKVSSVSESQTLERLNSFINITEDKWTSSETTSLDVDNEEFEVGVVYGLVGYNRFMHDPQGGRYQPVTSIASSNLKEFVSDGQTIEILNNISWKPNTSGSATMALSNSTKIFYSYATKQDNEDIYYILAITNTEFASSFRKQMSFQIIVTFALVFVFAFLILGLWGGTYVSRINRLKSHIKHLPSSDYQEEYVDKGYDELAGLSRQIEEMRIELKNNEATKQEMLQNVSHDFKTPISVIKSYAEAIEDGMCGIEDCKIIYHQAEILQHKVQTLLQYNRLEYLQKNEEFNEILMSDIVNSVINTYRYQYKNIEFISECDESIFLGYQENYYTVIDNLVDNARRYAKSIIKISVKNNVIEVYNDGEHIDEQFLNGKFKAYEKGSKGQFGLGMSIVKKTVNFFGYEISVKNEKIGVTFTISPIKND